MHTITYLDCGDNYERPHQHHHHHRGRSQSPDRRFGTHCMILRDPSVYYTITQHKTIQAKYVVVTQVRLHELRITLRIILRHALRHLERTSFLMQLHAGKFVF